MTTSAGEDDCASRIAPRGQAAPSLLRRRPCGSFRRIPGEGRPLSTWVRRAFELRLIRQTCTLSRREHPSTASYP